jgi:chemotaxis protein histidine kinase CheA
MAIDMAQFHQMFFDECEEMLDRAWRLLGNGEHFPQDEQRCRRALSLRAFDQGRGETFGFTPIGRIASALEASLDQVRDGQSKMDSDFGGVFREALDALRMHVAAYRKGLSPGRMRRTQSCRVFTPCRTGREGQATVDRDRVFELRFRMSHMIVGSELMMDFVLEELGRIGQVLATRGPAEDRADDEWQVDVLTSAGEAPLRAILDRIAEPGSLRIALRARAEKRSRPVRRVSTPPWDGAPAAPWRQPARSRAARARRVPGGGACS